MSERELTSKERNQLQAWDRFHSDECGVYPSTLAAMKIGITTSGLYQAGERGWIKFFKVGRDRWYGRKSVSRYRQKKIAGGNWQTFRSDQPRDCSENGFDEKGDWSPIEK